MNNTQDIFTLALGLEKPWIVREVSFKSETDNAFKTLHIYIDFSKGSTFKYNDLDLKCYDTEDKTWQHLNFFQHKCYLHARVPRVRLPSGKVHRVQVPWAREGSGFTLLFEAYSMLLIESEMPVNKAADCLDVYPKRLWTIFNYWIQKTVKTDDLSSVCEIGIDETSSKKGHEYVTTFVDLDQHRIIDVQLGRGKDTLEKFVANLELKGGDRKQIEQLTLDMSPSFVAGAMEQLPNAQLNFDKFHIIQHLNQAMDEVRKTERKGNELIKKHKYTFLKDRKKLSKEKQSELDYLIMYYPKLGESYRLKELFKDVYSIEDPQEAKGYLLFWCHLANESGIQPFIKFANMIKAHWFGICNYFDSKLTNAILESINSKIQLLKRRARGFRDPINFINMIFFICGKLKFEYPKL
jgi:transposase